MGLDWERARRKELATKDSAPSQRTGRKGSAIDILSRLQTELKRIKSTNWELKGIRKRDLALQEIERLRLKLLALRPGFKGCKIDQEAKRVVASKEPAAKV